MLIDFVPHQQSSPKRKEVVDSFIKHWIAMFKALVLGRAGKSNGKNKT